MAREKSIRELDGSEIKFTGTLRRHGVTIVVASILGAAAGTGIGYLVAVHGGLDKTWSCIVGGVLGFVVIGGITYLICSSIDQAEMASCQYSDRKMREAGLKSKGTLKEETQAFLEKANDMAERALEADRKAKEAQTPA